MSRRIPPEAVWAAARSGLARTACEMMDPADPGHDHTVCVRDDVSYAADLLLRLGACVAIGAEDAALDALTNLLEAAPQPG